MHIHTLLLLNDSTEASFVVIKYSLPRVKYLIYISDGKNNSHSFTLKYPVTEMISLWILCISMRIIREVEKENIFANICNAQKAYIC
jgi:hypothetical protein